MTRSQNPPTVPAALSVGFRPFFVLAALWSAIAIPLWLLFFTGQSLTPSALPPAAWHVHEMVYGYGAAVVAGFLLTAIANWTGRPPIQGKLLAALVVLWLLGRIAVLASGSLDASIVAAADLVFPLVFLAVAAREILVSRNWRNAPLLIALLLLFAGNLLVHLEALGIAATAALGNRLGVAVLLMLITFIGGRIIPLFTRNWLVKRQPDARVPAVFNAVDRLTLAVTALALLSWTAAPDAPVTTGTALIAGLALALRLARWRGLATLREPLLWVLHLGYGWLAFGFLLLGLDTLLPVIPPTAALHALTIGAIGTMTLAVMTRTSLGHTGQPLTAGRGTTIIYILITIAALGRLVAPLCGTAQTTALALAGAAWTGGFLLFLALYAPALARPRVKAKSPAPDPVRS